MMQPTAPLVFSLLATTLSAQTTEATYESVPLPFVGDAYRVSAALGDIDRDGIEDLVIGRNGTFSIRLGTAGAPERRFAAQAQPLPGEAGCSCENAGQPRLVDFDGDGDLDLVVLDTHLWGPERAIWFANDGTGTFAAARPMQSAAGADLAWRGQASAIEVVDWDADGDLDVILATPQLLLFQGGPAGFSAEPTKLGIMASAMAIADLDGDGLADLLTIEAGDLVCRKRTRDELGAAHRLTAVEGDASQARLAVADYDGDGKCDVLLGENVATERSAPNAERTAEDRKRLRLANRLLDAIDVEFTKLNRSRPPLGDADAMARRQQRRDELHAWAAGPRATREQLLAEQRGSVVGRMRVLLRRGS
jgi:hypothetical protein